MMAHRTIACLIILLLACLLVGSAAARLSGEWTSTVGSTTALSKVFPDGSQELSGLSIPHSDQDLLDA